ncbi:MAG TPA: monofunctional biosynthetic peptidoglycan transglycosylase [Rhabdaerophilum sp.]|nr:monofunctional biosynthetic peptidoglycan transglycosylase [Rhabdaerophilum sp.]
MAGLLASRPVRLALRLLLALVFVLVVSLVLGRFIPVPSTLMLGRWAIGKPVHREWRPIEEMSPHLVRGVVASEDQRFCLHHGVDFTALREVLDDPDGPSRGASTVTMQLVKNVYLWPGRSYVRKGLELPLALVADLVWGKRRVMEIYLNVAEWGDGIFGAEAAAGHYFGKHARDLSAMEAARLISVLPNPIQRNPRRVTLRAQKVRQKMQAVGSLTHCLVP